MVRVTAPVTAVERLTRYLCDGVVLDTSARELAGWLAESPRFRAFAEEHRDKIRKKLRGVADVDARRGVRAELRIAYLLLADRRVEIAFEAYGSTKGGPDFTVTLRGERTFNLEVTRLHRAPDDVAIGRLLLAKLRQLPTSIANVVLIGVGGATAEAVDIAAIARALRVRADAKDEAFFAARGFEGTRGFYQRFLRLGAVLVWCEGATGDDRAALWSNRSARIAFPERAAVACQARLRAG